MKSPDHSLSTTNVKQSYSNRCNKFHKEMLVTSYLCTDKHRKIFKINHNDLPPENRTYSMIVEYIKYLNTITGAPSESSLQMSGNYFRIYDTGAPFATWAQLMSPRFDIKKEPYKLSFQMSKTGTGVVQVSGLCSFLNKFCKVEINFK